MDRYKVRIQTTDVANQKNPTHKNAARIYLSQSTFVQKGFSTACLCIVETDEGAQYEASAWLSQDKQVANNIVAVSRVFQKAAGLEIGQVVRVAPAPGSVPVPDAGIVVMRDITPDATPLPLSEEIAWRFELRRRLEIAEFIVPGIPFEDIFLNGRTRSYIVQSVNGRPDAVAKYKPDMTIAEFFDGQVNGDVGPLILSPLPGMQQQTKTLNIFLKRFHDDVDSYFLPSFSCGVVIHGSHGTGRTMLIDHIAATKWGQVVRITHQDKPSTIKTHFETAILRRTPSILILDDIEELIGSERPSRQSYIDVLAEGLDSLARRARDQNMRPKVLVVATCLDYLTDIPYKLQSLGRFQKYIGLSVPDAATRPEILRSYSPKFLQALPDKWIRDLSDRTHAYTGKDLVRVIGAAWDAWQERIGSRMEDEAPLWEDLVKALKEVRPTAMHDINLKPPTVHWSDIVGYENVKIALQSIFDVPEATDKPLWEPSKGVLLYGPPGCSKTMTAQALATELDFNFFSVKGGELLNMYVGETERSIRNLFKRAQEASPSIIFFDEIDALAGSRSGLDGSPTSSSSGVQSLTTLLTEMDGFEQIGKVFVLATTNKPGALDPALLRPGRFDELVYVPLPELEARAALIANKTKKMGLGDIDVDVLARQTEGYSGAEIAGILAKAFRGVNKLKTGSHTEVLQSAIQNTPKMVSKDMLRYFEDWQKKHAYGP